MDTQFYLGKIVDLFKKELKDNLTGIYLHGSLAMGCFHPDKSDIDLLIVAKNKLTAEDNKRISRMLLSFHDELPNQRGIEVSILLEAYLKDFVHPTPFEFHYSDYHREKYRTDENYICGGFEDADLAAHIFVTYHRGVALYGQPMCEVFQPIDRQFYIASILSDIEDVSPGILTAPVYFTLNLCRVLYYLKEGVVSSKKEGGEWGLNALPLAYQPLIQNCLSDYNGTSNNTEFQNQQLLDFADYMINIIQQYAKEK